MNNVVIRLSSLGDIILAGSITKTLGSVCFITEAKYTAVASQLIGVSSVFTPEDRLPLQAARVIDLQGNQRSRKIARSIKGTRQRIRKPRWQHWQRIVWKRNISLSTIPERYAAAAMCNVASKPWIEIEHSGNALLLCPGAAHPTKCWPPEYFASIASRWPHTVFLVGSVDERDLLQNIVAQSTGEVKIIAEQGFEQTFQAISRSCIAIGNDTGLMHAAAATGLPVIMIFGPTSSRDGFWCHDGSAMELPLFCRPCSRFGGVICPMGDHACLQELEPDIIWNELEKYIS